LVRQFLDKLLIKFWFIVIGRCKLPRNAEKLLGIRFVLRLGQLAVVLLRKLVESLKSNMQLQWSVKFRIVRHQELRSLELAGKRLKVNELWHLDLLEQTATLVASPIL